MVLFFLDFNRALSYGYHTYYSIIHLSYMGVWVITDYVYLNNS